MRLFTPENPPFLDLTQRADTLSVHAIREHARPAGSTEESVATGVLFLWHDHWEQAHEIAQSREGERNHDFLHGILHRREGDFGNAGYWFRNAGTHPCLSLIAERVAMREDAPPEYAGLVKKWTPAAFVDAVRTRTFGAAEKFLRAVQAVEIMTFHEWLESRPRA